MFLFSKSTSLHEAIVYRRNSLLKRKEEWARTLREKQRIEAEIKEGYHSISTQMGY